MGYHLRVKICGVTTEADARAAAQLGADAVGLNFYTHSPRHIDPITANAVLRELPPFVHAVGAANTDGMMVPNGWYPGYQNPQSQAMVQAYISAYGGSLNYGKEWAGRYSVQKLQSLSGTLNPGLAYRVNEWLSLGAVNPYPVRRNAAWENPAVATLRPPPCPAFYSPASSY